MVLGHVGFVVEFRLTQEHRVPAVDLGQDSGFFREHIAASSSLTSLRRLIDGDELEDEDLITFSRLNSHCALRWYEPIVSLVRDPQIAPEMIKVFKHSVPGLKS